jgi:tRNA threonylcarbamoyladenosine biosynthesis protein TsaE
VAELVGRARTDGAAATAALGAAVGGVLRPGDVVVLGGELGAGKTAFARGVGDALDVDDTVVSPTFTIVHELHGRHRVAHADLYRVPDPDDLDGTGIEDYLPSTRPVGRPDTGDAWIVLVEWGEYAGDRLGAERLEVRIDYGDVCEPDDTRTFTVTAFGDAWSGRLTVLRDALAPWATDASTPDGAGRAP